MTIKNDLAGVRIFAAERTSNTGRVGCATLHPPYENQHFVGWAKPTRPAVPATTLLRIFATAAVILTTTLPAHADSPRDASRASVNASVAVPAVLVSGSVQMLKDAGRFSVTGITTVGDASVLTLTSVASGAEASVRFTGKLANGLVMSTGMVVEVVASTTGVMLMCAGAAIAYIPNEVGRSLLHHSRASRTY